jgi:hypothetical protein
LKFGAERFVKNQVDIDMDSPFMFPFQRSEKTWPIGWMRESGNGLERTGNGGKIIDLVLLNDDIKWTFLQPKMNQRPTSQGCDSGGATAEESSVMI